MTCVNMTASETFPRGQTLDLKSESYKCIWGKKASNREGTVDREDKGRNVEGARPIMGLAQLQWPCHLTNMFINQTVI